MDLLKCRYDKSQVGLFVWGRIPEDIPDCESYVEDILMKTMYLLLRDLFLVRMENDISVFHSVPRKKNLMKPRTDLLNLLFTR